MIYASTQPSVLITLIGILVIWYLFRREKRNKREMEERRERENLEASQKAEETVKRLEKKKQERESDEEKYRNELKTISVYLTEKQNEKEKFCRDKSGDFLISANAIYMLYQVLHQPTVEKQEMLDMLDDGKKIYCSVITMNKDDQERMEYCKEWLGVDETEAYAIGIEIYRQYLTQ